VTTLFAQFQIGPDWYVLRASLIARVLPLVSIKFIPGAPAGVAGVLLYGSTPVPVVDLSWLALGRPATRLMSTRIILVTPFEQEQGGRLLGMIAEKMTNTIELDEGSFIPSGVRAQGAAYVGPLITVGDKLVQRVDVQSLLPPAVFEALCTDLEVGG